MEQNKEMTAQESLAIIAETVNNSRKSIFQRSGKYLLVWGIALTIVSLLVFIVWKTTGKQAWNYLWFAMPVLGLIPSYILKSKETTRLPDNTVSRMLAGIWRTFGVLDVSISIFAILYAHLGTSVFTSLAVAISLSPMILLLFGMAETISGVAVKNTTIKVAGLITGVGGIILYFILSTLSEDGLETTLRFTMAGLVLAFSGIILQVHNKQ
ncbi:MAG: hypothetical protein J6X99_05430 [Bacteroidales bacterium]|nr:hypothetical protein [Bacteroidales bacterium]